MAWGRSPRSDVAEPGAGVEQPKASGSWLVQAEPVGGRGCLAATSDSQLSQDSGDVGAGGLGRMNSAWPSCRFVWPSATRASTSASRCEAERGRLAKRGEAQPRNPAVLAWAPVAAPSSSPVLAARAARPARAQPTVSHTSGSGQRPASEKRQLLVLARRRYLGR